MLGTRLTGGPFPPRRPIEIREVRSFGNFAIVIHICPCSALDTSRRPGMASLQVAASVLPAVHCRAGTWQKTPAQRSSGAGVQLRLPLSPPLPAQTWAVRAPQRRQATKAQAAVKTGAAAAPGCARRVIVGIVSLQRHGGFVLLATAPRPLSRRSATPAFGRLPPQAGSVRQQR